MKFRNIMRRNRRLEARDAPQSPAKMEHNPDFDFYGQDTSYYLDGLFGRHSEFAATRSDSLPNVFLLGAAKCGTTSLFRTLSRHPEIFGSRPKEPKFFGSRYYKGWDWYCSLFEEGRKYPVRMEGSVLYSSGDAMFLGSAQMISHYIRDPKFIYIVRDPMERIVSHWRHYKGIRRNYEGEFSDLFAREVERRRIVECSFYWKSLSTYRRLFGDASILCLTFEDLIADPPATLKRIFGFLGVSADVHVIEGVLESGKLVHANAASAGKKTEVLPPVWDPARKAEMLTLLKSDAIAVLDYIGKPPDFWKGIL